MSDSTVNVVALKGGGVPDKQMEAFRQLQANLQTIIEAQRMMASITRSKYLALIEQGFTEKEALELCK